MKEQLKKNSREESNHWVLIAEWKRKWKELMIGAAIPLYAFLIVGFAVRAGNPSSETNVAYSNFCFIVAFISLGVLVFSLFKFRTSDEKVWIILAKKSTRLLGKKLDAEAKVEKKAKPVVKVKEKKKSRSLFSGFKFRKKSVPVAEPVEPTFIEPVSPEEPVLIEPGPVEQHEPKEVDKTGTTEKKE
jgi:hypothetical protein